MSQETKTFHGTRALLNAISTNGNTQGAVQALGIFESIETGVSHDHFEPFILGRASAGEIVIMGQSPIMVRLSGFRKIDRVLEFGPHGTQNLDMNSLEEIIRDVKGLDIQIVDRVTGRIVMMVHECKVVSHNFSVAAKQPARLSLELVGLTYEDESGVQSEAGTPY